MARVVDDAMRAKLKAVEDPLRMRLLYLVERGGEWTAKDLAEAVGAKPNGLYYHLRILQEAGFVEEAGTRLVGRQHERLYRSPGEQKLMWDLEDPVQYATHLTSLLEVAKFDVEEAVYEQAEATAAGEANPLRVLAQAPEITTTAGEAWEFHKRLMALVKEFRDRAKQAKKNGATAEPRMLKFTYALRDRPVVTPPS